MIASVRESVDDFRIFRERAVGDGSVDLHEVLVYDSTGTDVEVTDFGITHLAVGEANIFAASGELGIGIGRHKVIHIGSRRVEDNIIVLMVAETITIEDDEDSFLRHDLAIE